MTSLQNSFYTYCRPALLEDATEITNLMIACDIAEYGVPDLVLEDTLEILSGLDLETNTWVMKRDEHLVAFGFLEEDQPGKLSSYGYVHPMFVGEGIGSSLIERMEQRAALYANDRPEINWKLSNVIPALNKNAVLLLEDRGYCFQRLYSRMSIELKGLPFVAATTDSIRITPFQPGSDRLLYEAYCETFHDTNRYREMTYEAWTAAKSENYYDRSLWFQAYEGEELVGFIITKNFKDHAFVDLLGVRRAWRKSGIALALLQSVYRACFDQGIHHVQLSVDASSLTGANRLYERAGMTASFQMGLYEKEYTKKYT